MIFIGPQLSRIWENDGFSIMSQAIPVQLHWGHQVHSRYWYVTDGLCFSLLLRPVCFLNLIYDVCRYQQHSFALPRVLPSNCNFNFPDEGTTVMNCLSPANFSDFRTSWSQKSEHRSLYFLSLFSQWKGHAKVISLLSLYVKVFENEWIWQY